MSTPIFDSVMADQAVEIMPLPPIQTHEEFLREHSHGQFLNRAELILKGEITAPKTRKRKPRR